MFRGSFLECLGLERPWIWVSQILLQHVCRSQCVCVAVFRVWEAVYLCVCVWLAYLGIAGRYVVPRCP